MIAFKYNKDAEYAVRAYNQKDIAVDSMNISVSQDESFSVKVSNPLTKYLIPAIKNDGVAKAWFSHPLQFFQNQLNFAVYCVTTGCGVSYADHLNHPNPMVRSVYSFHFYFQFRRILSELQAPLQHNNSFNPFSNRIDMNAFERI
jgi:hypothetical protein